MDKESKVKVVSTERWGIYRLGECTREKIISKNRHYFSSYLTRAMTNIQTFNLSELPKADFIVIYGPYNRTIRAVVEAMLIYKQRNDKLPDLLMIGQGGSFFERMEIPKWYKRALKEFGATEQWLGKYDLTTAEDEMKEAEKIFHDRYKEIGKRPRVLLFTSMMSLEATAKFIQIPMIDLIVWETPEVPLMKRMFEEEEIVSDGGYGLDLLMANILNFVYSKHYECVRIEKKLRRPSNKLLKKFLDSGHVAFCNDAICKAFAIAPNVKQSRLCFIDKRINLAEVRRLRDEFLKYMKSDFYHRGLTAYKK